MESVKQSFLKQALLFIGIGIIALSCDSKKVEKERKDFFTQELMVLKDLFSIPGLSATIAQGEDIIYEKHFGYSDLERQIPIDAQTAFPVASLTKFFSANLIMKLVEEEKLSLNDPVNQYLPEIGLDKEIKIKHLLSHTSQGDIGNEFYYSFRFGLLTQIIEKASGIAFKDLMEEEIFDPLELDNTFLLKDSAQLAQQDVTFALPYNLEEEIKEGFIDYGYSASAGIVSTSHDLLDFTQAIYSNQLITASSKLTLFDGLDNGLPYAYGIFKQEIEGLEVLWLYGQYDSYSSLLLTVPAKELTLVVLANNNLMSDPARLIMGDVMSSLFAVSFLKNYIFDRTEMCLLEDESFVFTDSNANTFYRKKVLAQALTESFMARFQTEKMKLSAHLIDQTFKKYPDFLEYADINLLHNLSFLKSVAFYRNLGEFNQFDSELEQIGSRLLQVAPNNPYAHSYMGTFYNRKGNKEKAFFHFKSIVDAQNFSSSWYTNEAKTWLIDNQ
ncbi:serine hydrolase domain-containing protein [Roseivirga sp.]|uniref:serine hydrolase domain-containing protein n=1 Tax=Roseivirga sp. TaxID=1964215 RepID=UPI003B8DEADE